MITGHPKIGYHIGNLILSHDMSAFFSLLATSALLDPATEVTVLSKVFIEGLDLKAVFSIAESVLSQSLLHRNSENIQVKCQSILALVKQANHQAFN